MPNTFPKEIYVSESIDHNKLEAYTTWSDAEEDDTVAVYELKCVCRVKHQTKKYLVDEEQLTDKNRKTPPTVYQTFQEGRPI